MRAFVALILPDTVIGPLIRLQERLPVGRPTPAENLHLTLAFLDDQPEAVLYELHGELETLRVAPFALALAGLECFGGRGSAVLAATVRPDPALSDLHRRVTQAVRRVGIALPRTRFRPHVTLARFARGLSGETGARLRGFLDAHAGFATPAATVTGLSLIRSTLRRQGALHEELARYDLT